MSIKYKCIKECYVYHRRFREGEVVTLPSDEKPKTKYFVALKVQTDPDEVDEVEPIIEKTAKPRPSSKKANNRTSGTPDPLE